MRWRQVVAIAIIGGLAGLLLATAKPGRDACSQAGPVHSVVIRGGKVTPEHTQAVLCQRLTITNLDTQARLMAFGIHSDHVPYDGVSERLLHQGQSLTVTLTQPGVFIFHDHLDDAVEGSFSVAKP